MTFKELITGQFLVPYKKIVLGSIPFALIAVIGIGYCLLEFFRNPSLYLVIPFLYGALLIVYVVITLTREVKEVLTSKY